LKGTPSSVDNKQAICLNRNKKQKLSIPRHDPIGKGLLMGIIAEADLSEEESLKLLEKVESSGI